MYDGWSLTNVANRGTSILRFFVDNKAKGISVNSQIKKKKHLNDTKIRFWLLNSTQELEISEHVIQ
jgi:hypothetical protein